MVYNSQLESCCSTCTILKLECVSLRRQLEAVTSQYENLTNDKLCDSVEQTTQTIYTNDMSCSSVQTDCLDQSTVEIQTEVISSNSMSTCSTQVVDNVSDDVSQNIPQYYNVQPVAVAPYDLHTGRPFSYFSASDLDYHTEQHYQYTFSNRAVAFYGEVPYQYGGTVHDPIPFEGNSYLQDIVSHLRAVLPNYSFNSALVTKFRDGNDFIGFHSDDEPEIVRNSYIVTVSLL